MKIVHMASKISEDGRQVSALCYVHPHGIDISKGNWTLRKNAVTCSRCRAILKEQAK